MCCKIIIIINCVTKREISLTICTLREEHSKLKRIIDELESSGGQKNKEIESLTVSCWNCSHAVYRVTNSELELFSCCMLSLTVS